MVQHPFYFIISIVLLVVVLGYVCNRVVFLQNARRVEGKVVSVTGTDSTCGSRRSRHSCTRFDAVVQYKAPETGRDYTVRLKAGTAYGRFQELEKARLRMGEQVRIAYDPNAPHKSFEDTFYGIWGTPLMLGFFQIVAFFSSFGDSRRRRSAFG